MDPQFLGSCTLILFIAAVYADAVKNEGWVTLQKVTGQVIPSVSSGFRFADKSTIILFASLALLCTWWGASAIPIPSSDRKYIATPITYAIVAFCLMGWVTYPTTHIGHIICWVSALTVILATNIIAFLVYGTGKSWWRIILLAQIVAVVMVFLSWLLPPKRVFNDVLFTPFEALAICLLSFPMVLITYAQQG